MADPDEDDDRQGNQQGQEKDATEHVKEEQRSGAQREGEHDRHHVRATGWVGSCHGRGLLSLPGTGFPTKEQAALCRPGRSEPLSFGRREKDP